MKLGPLDFRQPSTWRGLLGFAGVIGFSIHPELREQIATTLAALLCLIEMVRNEYRAPTARDLTAAGAHTTTGPERPGPAGDTARRLHAPAIADTPDLDPESHAGFGDR